MSTKAIAWYHSLSFKGVAVLLAIGIGSLLVTLWIINTSGNKMVLKSSYSLVEEKGRHLVEDLHSKQGEIQALANTIARTAEQLPKDETQFKAFFPSLFNFRGNPNIAGGGIWPEPNQFTPGIHKRSFFWARQPDGSLKYYDDYNISSTGYHHESWYVVARYTKPGQGFWSTPYIDPFSKQPMVTYSTGTYENGKFTGVVTIDLKLEYIDKLLRIWQRKVGGYATLLGRGNQFIGFPNAQVQIEKAMQVYQSSASLKMLSATDLAKQNPLFQPIVNMLKSMNNDMLNKAFTKRDFNARLAVKVNSDSYQINKEDAMLISAVLADPLQMANHHFMHREHLQIDDDFLLHEKSDVFIFHVPDSYWKLVLVKPYSQSTALTTGLMDTFIINMGLLILLLLITGYIALQKYFINPISQTGAAIQQANTMILRGDIQGLKNFTIKKYSHDEIGLLSDTFNHLAQAFVQTHKVIEQQNQDLEQTIMQRTQELSAEVVVRKKAEYRATQAKILVEENLRHKQKQHRQTLKLLDTETQMIKEKEKHVQELFQLSNHDALTQIPNRRFFDQQLQQAIALAQRGERKASILFLDLNRFKPINDLLGHAVGDEVLKEIAKRLAHATRDSDMIARIGGDEFTVLLPDTDPEQAFKVASKVYDTIRKKIILDQHSLNIGCSIGIATYPNDGDDHDTILIKADQAMYHAKSNHMGISTYHTGVEEPVKRRLDLEQALIHATNNLKMKLAYKGKINCLTTDNNEPFPVFYQPQHYTNGQLSGVESLLRWRHPVLGHVSPAEFIPVAENLGVIDTLTEWVLKSVSIQALAWEAMGIRPHKISVNISAIQFIQSNIVDSILQTIEAAGAKPHWFELEVTETAAMHDPEATTTVLQKLSDAGMSIALDDFGTGYSSLAYLKRLPIDILKIDIIFIRNLPDNTDDAVLVRSIIAMAHALNMKVVAEGVETEEQLQFLREHDCAIIQGYLYSKPLPAAEATIFLEQANHIEQDISDPAKT